MKIILTIIVLLSCCVLSFAQQTTVTGTIVDANGTAYAGCNVTANYQDPPPNPNITQAATINGSPLPSRTITTSCNAFGFFTFVLWDTNAISYGGQIGGGTWQYTVTMTVQAGTIPPWFGQPVNPTFSRTSPTCPAALCITGTSVDITTTLQPIPLLPFLGGLVGRLQLFGASHLTANDFTFNGWGTGATISNIIGSDSSFSVTVTAGVSPSINPNLVLKFHDGQWTSISSINAQVDSGTGNFSDIQATDTPTTLTLTYMNLPVATKTYVISVTVVGTSNLLLPSALVNAASVTGNNFFTGTNTFGKINGYCAVDGNVYASVSAALAGGCLLIDARGGLGSHALGTLDPGSSFVTILLGPYSDYTINQMTVRSGLNFIGPGPQQSGGVQNAATITSINASNQAPFVLPQTSNGYAMYATIAGFNLVCAASNTTQDGLQFDSSGVTNGGLWNSHLRDIYITGCNGTALHFKGASTLGVSENQVNDIDNVHAIRPVGSGTHSLVIEGNNETLIFRGGNYDLPSPIPNGSAGTNILVQNIGSGFPDSIVFENIHTQGSAVGINLNGCVSCAITHSHFELDFGDILLTNTATQANRGINITQNWFISGGINGGNGYVLKNSDSATDALFADNTFFNAPDNFVIGTNLASVKVRDNMSASAVPNSTGYSGTTTQLTPSATLTTIGAHTIYLNASGTAITTINSTLGPGEYITFICSLSSCIFNTGGNVDLTGRSAPLTLATNETATFVRNDINGTWRFVSTSTATINGITASGTFLPNGIGGSDLGSTSLPFGNLWLGGAATNNFKFQPGGVGQATVISMVDPGIAGVGFPFKIASGTATMTTAAISAGNCGTTVTVAASGVTTSDSIAWSFNAAPVGSNAGLVSWPTAGSVNFAYCPNSAETPAAATINWRVVR